MSGSILLIFKFVRFAKMAPYAGVRQQESMNYRLHLPILLVISIIQIFITDIYSYFYLKNAYQKYLTSTTPNSTLYIEGAYSPIRPKEAPNCYKFVYVTKQNNLTKEIYFTCKGEKIIQHYKNGKLKSSEIAEDGDNYFLFLPLCGVFSWLFVCVKFSFRTGSFFTWQQIKYNLDKTEKLLVIYSIVIFLSMILSMLLENWLWTRKV